MASYSFRALPEVFATSEEHTGLVKLGLREGRLRKLRRGLYTTNIAEAPEAVVRRNLWKIVSILCPGAVVSHRTAFEGRPTASGLVVVTGDYERKLTLPGLRIRQMKGTGPLPGDARFIEGLSMSSRPRFLLECLSGKVYGEDSPYLSVEAVEEFLERTLLLGEDVINGIRDFARAIAAPLAMEKEFGRLDAVIGALLGTRKAKLSSKTAIARAAGMPYDSHRIEVFQILVDELNAWPETIRPEGNPSDHGFANTGFFDAYFSNFIEGTEFEVEEAREIVFENKIPKSRPEDAHDVLGTFRIVGNPSHMGTQVSRLDTVEFLELLKGWHSTIMQGRPDKRPGQFKGLSNRAGNTLFVDPTLAEGTLRQGFELGRGLRTAFGRAVYLLFLVAEVHPFDDGNGRVARAVANAELVSHGECRLLVPTVFRVEYLDALRLLTRERKARTFVRMADQTQEFAADIDFSDFEIAKSRLTEWNAFDTDSEARLRGPRS